MIDVKTEGLVADNLSLTYYEGDTATYAVHQVSLSLPKFGFVGIIGPSGSGKSSLLYLLSGLKVPTEGMVYLDGVPYHRMTERQRVRLRRKRFGFVFQRPFQFGYLTAFENALIGAHHDDHQARRHAAELFDRLGINQYKDRFPHHLSGGERQRVCIARAMLNNPSVIFADEPTAALDHTTGHHVMDILTAYREHGLVVVVTHDPEMLAGNDVIYRLRDGELEEG